MSIDLKVSQVIGEDGQNILQEDINNTLEVLNVSEGVEIGDFTCINCLALKTVNMPKSMNKIGRKAFSGCENLANITIPFDLKTIGDYAFEGCKSISKLNLPNTITFIGDNAFASCGSNLELLVEAGSYAHTYVINKGLNHTVVSRQKYNIWFYNYDGTLLQTNTVNYGDTATYNGATPAHEKEKNTIWSFVGWDKNLENITEDTIFTAQYDKQIFHNVCFMNYSENRILWSSLVIDGDTAVYQGEELDDRFISWDKSLENITKDTIFYALYEAPEDASICNVTFRNYDGSLLDIEQVEKGRYVTYKGVTPCRPSTSKTLYEFIGWDKSLGSIAQNLTVYAQYNAINLYSVKFVDNTYTNTVLWSTLVKEGDTAVYVGPDFNGSLAGWDKSLENITEDTIIYAIYIPNVNFTLGNNINGEFSYVRRTLTLTGSGATYDYSQNQQANPINEFAEYVETIVVPDEITEFSNGIFAPCENLTSLTIPFVGKSRDVAIEDTGNSESTIGYLFGTSDTEKEGYTYQQCNVRGNSVYSKLPSKLEHIELTDAKIVPFGAFWGLSSLKSVIIGDSCKEMYGKCFYSCDHLEEMTVPFIGRRQTTTPLDYYYDTNIGYWFDFQRMQTVYDPNWTSASLTWKNEGKYTEEYTTPKTIGKFRRYPSLCNAANCLYFLPTTLKKVTITSKTLIPSYAFSGNDTIKEIYAPFAKEIGEGAFTSTNLSSYNFENIEIIGIKAFAKSSINKFDFPNLKIIGREAFAQCSSLKEVTLCKNASLDSCITITSGSDYLGHCFSSCNLDKINIYTPNIPYTGFSGCTAKEVVIDKELEYSSYAGGEIGKLNDELYRDGVLIIDDSIYDISADIQSQNLVIPDGIKKIWSFALEGGKFPKLTLPAGIENIGYQSFAKFDELEIENNDITTVFSGLYGFRYKDAFVGIVQNIYPEFYQDGMIVKGDTLYYCSPSVSGDISLPDNVKHIAPCAFLGRTNITTVKLPSQLESIGNYAFEGCNGLTGSTITIPKTMVSFDTGFGMLSYYCKNFIYEEGIKSIKITVRKNNDIHTIPKSAEYLEFDGYDPYKTTLILLNPKFNRISARNCNKSEFIDNEGNPIIISQEFDKLNDVYTGSCGAKNCTKISSIKLKGFDILYEYYAYCSSDSILTSASIENCKLIGRQAFGNCGALEEILNDNEVLTYMIACFEYCLNLKNQIGVNARGVQNFSFNHTGRNTDYEEFFIPEYLTNIGGESVNFSTIPSWKLYSNYGDHLFYDCGNARYFKEFVVHPKNQDFKAVDGVLYTMDGKRLIAAPRGIVATKENPLYIAEGVERIDELGLGNKGYLGAIVLPDSYEIIEFLPPESLNKWANTLTCAIYHYSPITHIFVKETNPRYVSVDGVIYSKDMRELWATTNYQSGELVLQNGLTHIRHGVFTFDTKSIATGTTPHVTNNKFTKVSIPATCYDIDDFVDGVNEFTKLGWLVESEYCTIEIDECNRWYSVGESALVKKSSSESAFSYIDDVFDIVPFSFTGILKTALCFSRFANKDFDITNLERIYESEHVQSELIKNRNNISGLLERLEYYASKNARPVILMIDDRTRLVTSYTDTGSIITLSCYTGEINEAINVDISYSGNTPASVTEYYYNEDAVTSNASDVYISFVDTEDIYVNNKNLIDNANS